nr:hypothetical protein [Mucilaginibacter sp. SP1R1]
MYLVTNILILFKALKMPQKEPKSIKIDDF